MSRKKGERRKVKSPLCAFAVLALAAAPAIPQSGEPVQFVDVAAPSGVAFRHAHGGSEPIVILENVGAGCALFDYDNDGDLDAFFVNGCYRRTPPPGPQPTDALYRNDGSDGKGGWRFTDVTRQAGIEVNEVGYGMGCCVGDYDNDGDLDLYVTNYGPNVLYRNNGDGTFTDVARQAGVDDPRWGTGCAFGDYDRDGDLDLYVANYVVFRVDDPKELLWCFEKGIRYGCSPFNYRPDANVLYRNDGPDGKGGWRFVDVTRQAGVADPGGKGLGVTWGDYDDDGDEDLYVANDATRNALFRNHGDGTFADVTDAAGVGYDEGGKAQASMGVAFDDLDNDGRLDLFVTNFSEETSTFYHNDGNGFFTVRTAETRLGAPGFLSLKWGTAMFDCDNDGDRDIFTANGHVYDVVERFRPHLRFKQKNQLFRNDGPGPDGTPRFSEVTDRAGPGLQVVESSRGAAFGDFDEDGDLDILVQNMNAPPTLLRNDGSTGLTTGGGNQNHWIRVKLEGGRRPHPPPAPSLSAGGEGGGIS
ncbi:VCBS repeat-containing protein, partial [bacterium]|nr:VCBS repeat-containing protein [bacterium]